MAAPHESSSGLAIDRVDRALHTLSVWSNAFESGGVIPEIHSAYGGKQSPDLEWEVTPPDAVSIAIVMEDPGAPWVHWVLYNIPARISRLPECLPADAHLENLGGALHGNHGGGEAGYFGPMPPRGDGVHHYHFEVFALDAVPDLPAGATRDALVAAMKGHVLACGELVGTYTAE